MEKTFVIGDIHGCDQLLDRLLARIAPDLTRDVLVFLGDYINRGPGSRAVVSRLIALRRLSPQMITLMGNHEQVFLDFLAGRRQEFFLRIGGRGTLASYGLTEYTPEAALSSVPTEHLDFFNELLLSWEDEENIYVHAGLEPGVHLAQQSTEWLLWARERFLQLDVAFAKRVIHGHTPVARPQVTPHRISLDTGAIYGGPLTCLILPEERFVSVVA